MAPGAEGDGDNGASLRLRVAQSRWKPGGLARFRVSMTVQEASDKLVEGRITCDSKQSEQHSRSSEEPQFLFWTQINSGVEKTRSWETSIEWKLRCYRQAKSFHP